MITMKTINKTSLLLLLTPVILVSLVVFAKPAQAAAVTGFDAGNIMDDAIFTKKSSMSTAQIQTFLNSKVPTCDTNGTKTSEYGGGTRAQYGRSKGYPPPYKCLKDYTQGGKTAAKIIYDAAQEFSINPQVLIVLLQKEQGLVTDTWPWSLQYKTATGYGCPDTAACDSQYYGFTNQVRWAARMFRAILNQSPTWYTPYDLGNNKIYWHPDTARCGSSTVNIQNLTTVALYSYTPYRPNQAALNAGYGTGNSCSAYGNRNFYQYFKDWFGSTHSSYSASITEKHYYTDSARTNEVGSIPSLRTGQLSYVTIKAKNTGSKTWERSFTRIGTTYSNNRSSLFADSSWLNAGRPAQLVETSVAPGGTGTFRFSVTAPKIDGSYTEKFQIVAEGKQWMQDNAAFSLTIPVSNPYNATINSVRAYTNSSRTTPTSFRVKTGSTTYWRVSAKNIGENTWGSIVKLGTSSPQDRASTLANADWLTVNRATQLEEASVAKNSVGTFDFQVKAPGSEGSLNEFFSIVAEGQSWMPNSSFSTQISTAYSLDTLNKNQTLYLNEVMAAPRNGYKLILGGDGNLVLKNSSNKVIWSTKTIGKGVTKLILGGDGNLVLKNSSNKVIWSTKTIGR